MNPRDFLTSAAIGLVVVVGGLAIADSVRGCDRSDRTVAPPPAEATTTTENFGPGPRPDAPAGWSEGTLDGVLTFVDADTCRLRAIGLSGGRERPLRPFRTDCDGLWAPPISARLAYGFSADRFQIADLGHGDRLYGEYQRPVDGEIVWSFDGQRLAWCDSPRTGVEREVLGGERSLGFCPLAYTPEGDLVHAEGRRIVRGTETLVRTSGGIGYTQFGHDGSIVVVVDGERVERHAPDGTAVTVILPATWTGGRPVASPDGCAVAVPVEDGVSVIPLCPGGAGYGFPGHSASWSPDGEWIAVADTDGIFFYEMGAGDILHWPAVATQLAWRPS